MCPQSCIIQLKNNTLLQAIDLETGQLIQAYDIELGDKKNNPTIVADFPWLARVSRPEVRTQPGRRRGREGSQCG
jgi:hypothetical protein